MAPAKKAKMGHGLSLNIPFSASKNKGVTSVMSAAKTQCVLDPKDWPEALTLLGNISDIKTHMTAPCPSAWEAMNRHMKNNKKTGDTPT